MGNMHLVTGYQGQEHVTAADHGSLYAAIFGSGGYVLDRGNKLAASLISSNQVRIADGDMVIQGRHVRLNEGSSVDLTIENGAQGYKRNDLISARYTRNASTGVEEVNLVVIKGTAVTSDPTDPEYNNGDILNDHAETADFPLYRIRLDGITVGAPETLFTVVPAYGEGGLNYIPNSQAGIAGGVATLDNTGKVPSSQLPAMNYIPTSQKGVALGVATLNESGMVPPEQLITSGQPTSATPVGNSCTVSLYASSRWVKIGKLVVLYLHFSFRAANEAITDAGMTLTGVPKPIADTQGLWTLPNHGAPYGVAGFDERLYLALSRNDHGAIGTTEGASSVTLVYFTTN